MSMLLSLFMFIFNTNLLNDNLVLSLISPLSFNVLLFSYIGIVVSVSIKFEFINTATTPAIAITLIIIKAIDIDFISEVALYTDLF